MKPIEELGISPSPWVKYGDIVEDAEGNVIFTAYDGSDFQDAQLISAAPKMYEFLRDAVTCKCAACGGYDTFYCKGRECQVKKWRAVLDKVSGEMK